MHHLKPQGREDKIARQDEDRVSGSSGVRITDRRRMSGLRAIVKHGLTSIGESEVIR